MRQLAALFNRPQVSVWDVIDILIVSFLIYEALKLIRGTRAMQMAIGSVLVILLLYVSQAFPLRTVGWLIRNLLAYVVFAAIVLFQSDIRRALSHLGARRSSAISGSPSMLRRRSRKSSPPRHAGQGQGRRDHRLRA